MKKTKRAVSLLLVLAMIVAMFTVGLTQTGAAGYDGPPILGDVDSDGSVTLLDALNLQLSLIDKQGYISGAEYNSMPHTQKEFRVANCYKDEVIDLVDVLWIQLYRVDNKAAIDAGIGKPLDDLPTEPTQPATVKPTETQAPTTKPTQPVTTKPTETQAPTTKPTQPVTTKPTETQAPTTKPTQPVTTKPTETQAPTTKPVGTATVTLKNNGVEYETKTFNVGDTFTVYTILNTSSIDSGKISTAAGEQYYTKELLARVDALDDEDLIEDTETVFPILSQGNALGNGMDEGILYFSGSNASKKKPYVFNTDSSKLLVTQYTVTAAGKATVETNLKTLALTDDYLTKIVDKYVTQDGYSFTYFSTFTDNGVAPTSTATTAPTIKPTETQAPTTKPTQPVTTKPTETQAPTTKPTQPVTTKPTETQAPTTKPVGTATVTLKNNGVEYETKTFNVGDTFTVYTILNTSSIDSGKISTAAGEQYYTKELLARVDTLDDEDLIEDVETVLPILSQASAMGNGMDEGILYFSGSNASKKKPYIFNTDSSKLLVTQYTVTAAGKATVETNLKTLALTDDYLTKIVDKYVTQDGYSFTYFSTFTDNGVAPTSTATTAPTIKPTETQAPTTKPTQPVTTKPTETQAPTTKPTQPVTTKPTETQAPTTKPTETQAPTAKPTETQAPTTPPEPVKGFYIVGSMNDNTINLDYLITEQDESGSYVFKGLQLKTTDQFKVAYSDNGKTISRPYYWYPSGSGNSYGLNGEIKADGTYNVYFRPKADGGDDWFHGVLYVVDASAPTAKPTETQAPTVKPTEAPTPVKGFYIVGSMTDMKINSDYLLTEKDEAGSYVFKGLQLKTTDYFKVAYTDNGKTVSRPYYWYPSGNGNNYGENGEIKADSTYNVYFRPTADGGEDWFHGVIYVEDTVAPTAKPTETQAATTAPSGKATVTLVNNGVQYESKTFNVGDTFNVYTILNTADIDSGKISTVAGSQKYTSSVLAINDALNEEDLIEDTETVFPILSQGNALGNGMDEGVLYFSGSNASKTKPYVFNSNTSKLAVTSYKVTAAGDATVETNIKTLALTDDYLTKIVDKYVTQGDYSFTFFSTFTDNGVAPTSAETTAPTIKPTETQAPTTKPTETQAPTTKPTETQAPTTKPTETQAPSTAPEGKATVTLVNSGVQYESKTFNVGDTFTVYTILNTSSIDSGKISTVAGDQNYTSSVLTLTDAIDSEGLIDDVDKVFPILSEAIVIGNSNETGILHFTGSNASKTKPYIFNADTSKLVITNYKVTAPGNATVETNIKTLAQTDDYLTKIVDKYVTQSGYSFTFFSTFTDNGTAPTSSGTTAPTVKPTSAPETQAPTTKPTSAPETQKPTSSENDVTLYFSNNKGWNSVNVYMWSENGGESTAWPGVAPTYVGTNDYGESIYSVTVNTDQYDKVIFNGTGGQTEDVDVATAVAKGSGLYCLDEQNDLGHYLVGYYEYTEQPTSTPETQKPSTSDGEDVTLYFSNNKGWSSVNVYMWSDNGESTAWPGVAATYVGNNDYGEGIYSVTVNTAQYDKVIFNGSGGQTEDVDVATAKAQGSGLYCLDERNELGHYLVGYYEYNQQPTQSQETQAPTTKPTTVTGEDVTLYFSNNKGWDSVNVYMWSENGGESTAWPGVAATYVGNNDYGEGIYSVTLNTAQYDKVIFNGSGGQTEDVDVAAAVAQGNGIYCLDEQNDLGHYKVGFYEYTGTTQPTTAPETQAPETQAPTTKPTTVTGEDVTLYFSNNKGWDSVNVYMWSDGGESTAWPGVAATYVGNNDYGEGIYSVTLNTAQYDSVIFNGSGGQTEDVDVAAAVAQGNGLYCLDEQNDLGHYKVGFYEYTGTTQPTQAQETQAPATQAPTTKPTTVTGEDVTLYFSNNKGWDSVNVYMWSENGGESTEWPGVAATYVGNNDYGEGIYSVTLNTAQYDKVIFNGSGGQTEDVDVAAAKAQGSGLYCLDEQNDLGHYKVGFYEYTGTAQPTQAQETQAQETQAPTTKPTTVTGEDVTLYFSNNKGWDSVNVYMWSENGGESTEWPGVAATYVGNNDYGEGIYSVTLNTAQYDKVIFNGSGSQTEDVDVATAVAQGNGLYCKDTQNDLGHYEVGFYEYTGTTQPTQAPATQAPTTKPTTVTGEDVTLYFTNNKNWSSVNVYMWSDGGESTAWPGVAATYVGKNAYEEDIYSVTVNTAQYDMVIFNGSGGQTEDVDVASAAAQGCGLYCKDTQNDLGHYEVGYYDYSDAGEPQQPTQAQETQAPTESTTVSFLLTDNFGWGKAYVYAWDDNGNELNGSWPGASQAETITNDYGETQFRCVVPAGATGVILNNGSGAQTEDITDFTYTGYWMDGSKNDLGHYKVIGWK